MAEIFEVVKAYRKTQKLSLREFASEINKQLMNTSVTYATVSRWEDKDHPNEPDLRLLFECLATYRDWKAVWAKDCLQSMFPDLFQSGVIRIDLPKAE